MPAQPGDILELTVDQSIGGVNVANVYHYQSQWEADDENDQNKGLIEAFRETVEDAWAALVSPEISVVCYTSKKIWPADEATDAWIDVVSVPGTNTGDALPPNKNYVMQLLTAFGSPERIGRKLYPGPLEVDDTEGQVHASIFTNWDTLAQLLIGVITDVTLAKDYSLGIFSRSIAKRLLEPNPPAIDVWKPIVKAWILPTVRSLRDRVARVVLPTEESFEAFSAKALPASVQAEQLRRAKFKRHPGQLRL